MITIEIIRKHLIEAIKESGLTQCELAKRLNIKQQSVQQYLAGKTLPALDTFANLCKVLDVDPKDLLGLDD